MIELAVASALIGAAGYRAWRIFGLDTITEPARAWLIARDDRPAVRWFTDLILCPWCLGWWICGVLTIVVALALNWTALAAVLVWLASSTVCGMLGGRDE